MPPHPNSISSQDARGEHTSARQQKQQKTEVGKGVSIRLREFSCLLEDIMGVLIVLTSLLLFLVIWMLNRLSKSNAQCRALDAVGVPSIYKVELPLVGHVYGMMDASRFSLDALKTERGPRIGYLNIMGNVLVVVKDFEMAKEVLAKMVKGDTSMEKMVEMYAPIELIFGGTSVLSERTNERHAQIRRVIGKGFKHRNLALVKAFLHEELLPELEQRFRAQRVAIDVGKEVTGITFRVIIFLLFGQRLSAKDCIGATDSLAVLLRHSWLFSQNPIWASVSMLGPTYRGALNSLRSFVQTLLLQLDPESDEALAVHMVKAGWPQERLMCELLLMVFGGYETTANSTANAIYETLKSGDEWEQRLRADVARFEGDALWRDYGAESEVAHAIFKETLRLHTAAPGGTVRLVPQEGVTIGGYTLPPGVGVIALLQVINCFFFRFFFF